MSYVRTRVASSDWCASRIVVSVMSSRFCLRDPLRELLRPQLQQLVAACPAAAACPWRKRGIDRLAELALRVDLPLHLRPAVDDHVAEVAQDLRRAVAPRLEAEQLRRVVDERRRRVAGDERRVADQVLEERDVRLHAADAELAQGAVHALDRFVERRAPAW